MAKAKGSPRLSAPETTPRIGKSGDIAREKAVFAEQGGEGPGRFDVKVTPLRGAGGLGAQLGGGRLKPRAIFEVRAEYRGFGLPEFGRQPGTLRIETYQTEQEEKALVLARQVVARLRAGERDILLNRMAEDLERRRG